MREWLVAKRKQKKLSQKAISLALNISQSYYCEIEKGTKIDAIKIPLDLAAKLAELLGMTLDDIRREEEALKNAEC